MRPGGKGGPESVKEVYQKNVLEPVSIAEQCQLTTLCGRSERPASFKLVNFDRDPSWAPIPKRQLSQGRRPNLLID